MNEHQLEEAIKHDLLAIPSLKLSKISAKAFYGPIAVLVLKIAMMFLGVNTVLRIALSFVGLYHPSPLSPSVLLINLMFCILFGLFVGFNLARPILFGKMLNGQLKTGVFLKQKYKHFGRMFFLVYAGVYLIMTAFLDSGIGLDDFIREDAGLWLVFFTTPFSQFFAVLVAMAATYFTALFEFDRLGLAPLITVIQELVRDRETHQNN